MNCHCGFQFAGPGEFRNCEAFILDGKSGVICPVCKKQYIIQHGRLMEISFSDILSEQEKKDLINGNIGSVQ